MKQREPDAPSQARDAVEVTGLTYGPHAVARRDGKVVFVRGAVPGDEVTLRMREEHRSYSYADVAEIVRPSPDRRQPPCPYLPRCGGCPWQHITYPAQLAAKEAIVREHLSRAVALEQTACRAILPSPAEFGYRHRLSLRVDGGRVGFFAGGSHELVPVDRCLLGEAGLDEAIPLAADWIARLESVIGRLEILLAADRSRLVLAAEAQGRLAVADDAACRTFLAAQAARVAGLVLRGRRVRRVWGDDRCALELEPGVAWVVRAGTFTQVSRSGNRLLLQAVLDAADLDPRQRVLDLFAGAGNLSLPIARRVAQVVAVERAGLAAEDGVANARALGLANCSFRQSSASAAVAAAVRAGERYEVVVLDPPRSGAADVIPALLRLAAARVIYVSCDPATLARDLRMLGARYRVVYVQPIDLFPQTYHVETVVAAVLA